MVSPSSASIVMEEYRVSASSPLPSSLSNTLPLTFFDVPWLYFISSPIQSLFFYRPSLSPPTHTHTSSSSTTTILADLLKRSLSLTLHHFHLLAGHLITLDHPFRIVYSPGDSVSFTVAHSDAGFDSLSGDHPRDAHHFYPLLPRISSTKKGILPLLAVRLTLFQDRGICIGLTCHHVTADSRTFNMFIKTWAFISKHGSHAFHASPPPPPSLLSIGNDINNRGDYKCYSPFYDRSVIKDDNGLIYSTLLGQYLNLAASTSTSIAVTLTSDNDNKSIRMHLVRSTFLCGPTDMGMIKRRILALCRQKNQKLPPSPLSPYVLVCAFVWICLVKSTTITTIANTVEEEVDEEKLEETADDDEPIFFGFNAGGISRLNFEVPQTYFGNCVAFGRSMITKNELMGDNGIVLAAKAIGSTIKKLDDQVLGGVQDWIKEWEPLIFPMGAGGAGTSWEAMGNHRHPHVVVSGSPKVDLYATDFGWGKPTKIEDVSIDDHIILSNGRRRAISLTESRNVQGGIEVGLVLPKHETDAFVSHFNMGLGRA